MKKHGERNAQGRKRKKNQPRKQTRKMIGGKMTDGGASGANRDGRSDDMRVVFSEREEKNIFC